MKKLILLILISIIGYLNTYAQLSHSFSVEAAPLYSYRYILNKKNGNINERFRGINQLDMAKLIKERRDTIEFADFGYSGGIKYQLRKNRFGFSTGIEYASFGEKEKQRLPKGHFEDYNGRRVPTYDGTEDFQFNYYYRQITLPLNFSYAVLDKKTKVHISLGPHFNYVFSHGIKYPGNYDALLMKPYLKDVLATYNPFTVGAAGGIRIEREITSKNSIRIEPGFFTQITPVLHIANELMQYNYFGRLSFSLIRKIK